MAAETVRLQRLFDEAGLPLLILKGASLAMLAYGNLGMRSAKDIDLLIRPEITRASGRAPKNVWLPPF